MSRTKRKHYNTTTKSLVASINRDIALEIKRSIRVEYFYSETSNSLYKKALEQYEEDYKAYLKSKVYCLPTIKPRKEDFRESKLVYTPINIEAVTEKAKKAYCWFSRDGRVSGVKARRHYKKTCSKKVRNAYKNYCKEYIKNSELVHEVNYKHLIDRIWDYY